MEPITRQSLMVRLRDSSDQQAWHQFVSIYEPLILRLMKQRGFQEADARDLTQQVIITVSQVVDRWEPDGQNASFRRWLSTIARRAALKFVQRGKATHLSAGRGTGGSEMLQLLDALPEPDQTLTSQFDDEYRTELFRVAAESIRTEFRDSTWQAFWRTAVLQESVKDVAEYLGISPGNVYVARSRVLGRLRTFIEEQEAEDDR